VSTKVQNDAQHGITPPLLELDRLHVTFGDAVAVNDVTLAIQRGERVALVGEDVHGGGDLALGALGQEGG